MLCFAKVFRFKRIMWVCPALDDKRSLWLLVTVRIAGFFRALNPFGRGSLYYQAETAGTAESLLVKSFLDIWCPV